MLAFALAFLFETWIWNRMVAAVRFVAARIAWERFKTAARLVINRMPAFVAVLLFGVPLVVSEFGSFLSVVAIAMGHVVLGATAYITLKIVGVGLLAVIFDVTREKLMTLAWFVYLHAKFVALHEFAESIVEPYRDAALEYLRDLRARARDLWLRLLGERAAGRLNGRRGPADIRDNKIPGARSGFPVF